MKHKEILQKKHERLSKYDGKALKRKQAAYERAVKQYHTKSMVVGSVRTVASAPVSSQPATLKSPVDVKIETADPRWEVSYPDGAFTIHASSEKKARELARKCLSVPRLPAGTKFKRVD